MNEHIPSLHVRNERRVAFATIDRPPLDHLRHPSKVAARRIGRSSIRAPVLLAICLVVGLIAAAGQARAIEPNTTNASAAVRLWTLDCGQLDFRDMSALSDTGEYAGHGGTLQVPCFLIRHGDDWMLWDAGLGDDIAALPDGRMRYGFRWSVKRTLRSQLAELGLAPADIRYVALSHVHADHAGNVGLFPKATFLVSPIDLRWGLSRPTPVTADPALVRIIRRARVQPVVFDLDVFGDGTVTMLRMPGHSPGHHCLEIQLANTGAVLLSGDLFHTRAAYDGSLVPTVNDSRADTLASMQRFRRLAEADHARVVIQHSPEDVAGLPAFPAFLD